MLAARADVIDLANVVEDDAPTHLHRPGIRAGSRDQFGPDALADDERPTVDVAHQDSRGARRLILGNPDVGPEVRLRIRPAASSSHAHT